MQQSLSGPFALPTTYEVRLLLKRLYANRFRTPRTDSTITLVLESVSRRDIGGISQATFLGRKP